jgi:pimeloyl-ACP methyl ester carboxylesterase
MMPRLILAALIIAAALPAKTAMLDGRRVFYESSGQGARTLVLVHGWTCDHSFWAAQVPAFSQKYRVIAIDLPGHGRSEAADSYPMSLFARAIDAVLRQEGIPKATLMGHSMGGAVLLEFSRAFPDELEAAVLVDAFMAGPDWKTPTKVIESLQGAGGLEVRRKMVTGMLGAAAPESVREHILKVMLAAPESLAVGAMTGMFSPATWRPGQSGVPTLAIVAHPEQIREESLRARWPRLTYRSLPGTGHFLMMEKPIEFNDIVLAWLAQPGN